MYDESNSRLEPETDGSFGGVLHSKGADYDQRVDGKRTTTSSTKRQIPSKQFKSLCCHLGLDKWTEDGKIEMMDASKVRQIDLTSSKDVTKQNLVALFFRQILSNDHRALNIFQRDSGSYDENEEVDSRCLSDHIDFDDEDSNRIPSEHLTSVRDVIFAILHCCDDFLRQQLLSKMVNCQIAVPVILPKRNPNEGFLFLLWDMFMLHIQFEGACNAQEECVATYPFPTVAFLKIGNINMSKSEIVNKFVGIAQGNVHFKSFLTSEDDADIPSKWSNGTVEAFWHAPMNENSKFPATCILNLRGSLDLNAPSPQERFLNKYATCVIVFCNADDSKEVEEKIISGTAYNKTILVIVEPQGETKRVSNSHSDGQPITIRVRGAKSIKVAKELVKQLEAVLKSNKITQTLNENGAKLCEEYDIENNVLSPLVKAAEQTSRLINRENSNDKGSEIYKKEVFKLTVSWREWSREFKDTKWKRDDRMQEIDEKEQKKLEIRREQLQIAISPEMKTVISKLLNEDTYAFKHILYWLRVFYNLRVQETEYYLTNLQQLKEKSTFEAETTGTKSESEKLSLEERLANNSLSASHIIRELGQIYECRTIPKSRQHVEDGTVDEVNVRNLPQRIASLILKGMSFEFFDGDACNIPLSWVGAVLNQVNKLTNDARIFTISVLGMQSSGKSTLLNSMFGIDFPVSPGRCTRGVSLQLLEVDDSLKAELGIEYIALIDTEGLGAPEKYSKGGSLLDNELATFSICLSDLTLINVRGEYISRELNDILQISAYAFMRMTKVQIRSYCRIILQSVNDITAHRKNKNVEKIILNELNEAVRTAAEQEGRGDEFSKFTDIFNLTSGSKDELNIHYIPGFSQENKSNYSESVLNLKKELISWMKKSNIASLSVSEFSLRLRDLWMAIIQEDFVFSFKNSVEIKAYNDMKKAYREHLLACDISLLSWELDAEDKLANTSPQNMEKMLSSVKSELSQLMSDMRARVSQEVTKYIKEQRHISLQRYEPGLLQDLDLYLQKNEKDLNNHLESKTNALCQGLEHEDADFLEAKETISLKLQESASQLTVTEQDSIGIHNEDIDEIFENVWKEQTDVLLKKCMTPKKDVFTEKIKLSILQILRKNCESIDTLAKFVKENLETKDLEQYFMPVGCSEEQSIEQAWEQLQTEMHEDILSALNEIRKTCKDETELITNELKRSLSQTPSPHDKNTVKEVAKVTGSKLPSSSQYSVELISVNLPNDEFADITLDMRHSEADQSSENIARNTHTYAVRFLKVHLRPYQFELSETFKTGVSLLMKIFAKFQHDSTFDYYPTMVCLISWLSEQVKTLCQMFYLIQVVTNPESYLAIFGEPVIRVSQIEQEIKLFLEKAKLRKNKNIVAATFSTEQYTELREMAVEKLSKVTFPSSNLYNNYKKIAEDYISDVVEIVTTNNLTETSSGYREFWKETINDFVEKMCNLHELDITNRWIKMLNTSCHGILCSAKHVRNKLRASVLSVSQIRSDPFKDKLVLDKSASLMPWHTSEIQFLDRNIVDLFVEEKPLTLELLLSILAKNKRHIVQQLLKRKAFEPRTFELAVKKATEELMKLKGLSAKEIATSLVHLGAWALPLCVDTEILYSKSQNVASRIVSEKAIFYEEFSTRALIGLNDNQQAKIVFRLLQASLRKAVANKITTSTHEKFSKLKEFSSRDRFLYEVLLRLCEKENFSLYVDFIFENTVLMELYATGVILEKCVTKEIVFIGQEIFEFLTSLRKDVRDSIEQASHETEHGPIDKEASKNWLQTFINLLHDSLKCGEDELKKVKQCIHIKDLENFQKLLISEFDELCDEIRDKCEVMNGFDRHGFFFWLQTLERDIPKKIVSRLVGCEEYCPFCRVRCDEIGLHEKHSSKLHLPIGISGYKDPRSNTLYNEICTVFVSSELHRFNNTSGASNRFSDYQSKYPNWFIKPECSAEANDYWKWVLKTFNTHFSLLYCGYKASIPPGWMQISKDDAKECIRNVYDVTDD